MTAQHTLTEFHAGTPRPLRERTANAETGCACPNCHANIAHTRDQHPLSTGRLLSDLREAIDRPTVRMIGWVCDSCDLLVPRNMEHANSCWSKMTNADKTYVGVLIDRPVIGDQLIVPVHHADLPATFHHRASLFCPTCGTEYGACVMHARVPCRPCRGGPPHRRWTKPWGDSIRTTPLETNSHSPL